MYIGSFSFSFWLVCFGVGFDNSVGKESVMNFFYIIVWIYMIYIYS
jgi:hypothetical protein